MAPVKFDDLEKVAKDLLSDDFQSKGYQLKTKQKTSFDGAVLTATTDLFAKEAATASKLSWKLPMPFGCDGFAVDKLEMDKAGKFKCEASSGKMVKDLKLEVKSDLVDAAKLVAGFTYTGLVDTQVKFETKAMNPQSFSAEVTRAVGDATVGVKFAGVGGLASPDLGANFRHGPYFGSLLVREKFGAITAHGFYQASDALKLAATYEQGGKNAGNCSLGVAFEASKETSVKAKVAQDQSVSCTVKHALSKGFTVLAGGMYDMKKQDYTVGLQLSIE